MCCKYRCVQTARITTYGLFYLQRRIRPSHIRSYKMVWHFRTASFNTVTQHLDHKQHASMSYDSHNKQINFKPLPYRSLKCCRILTSDHVIATTTYVTLRHKHLQNIGVLRNANLHPTMRLSTVLLRTQVVPSSNLGPETSYLTFRGSV
jgi:hypothetical protein